MSKFIAEYASEVVALELKTLFMLAVCLILCLMALLYLFTKSES
jgi:hypothetical protein